jgi:hypothetical protein
MRMSLEYRTLTQDHEIEAFLESFKRYVNVKLPTAYANCGKVIGVFKGEDMIGGYMIITRGPFRALTLIPDEVKQNMPLLKNGSASDFVEVNGFWVKEAYRRSAESLQMWLRVRKEVLRSKASYFLIFYNTQATGLAQIYEDILDPELIYQGAPAANSKTSSHAQITVGISTRLKVRLSIYRGIPRIMNRKILAWMTPAQPSLPSRRS